MSTEAFQQCINPDCRSTYAVDEVLFACSGCGSLLDVGYDWDKVPVPDSLSFFAKRWASSGRSLESRADYSGVWRFRELLPFARLSDLATIGEGRTTLQQVDAIARRLGMKSGSLFFQYEGFNPSGSFKDNGMAAAFTVARMLNRKRVACASTGNTSASMAMFASVLSESSDKAVQAIVFVGSGKIAYGKLSQALDYGATTLQIAGDFDACMRNVADVAEKLKIYLMNSVNPFRLEGQKTIMYRVLEGLSWEVPDWIIVPGGNLGNSSAFGKAFAELHQLGLIDRIPRIAIINAAGANTLCTLVNEYQLEWQEGRIESAVIDEHYSRHKESGWRAQTIASAIEIGRPVNLTKALRTLHCTNGLVRQIDDETILEHKALIGRHGYGCEPASAASLAGLRLLRDEGVIGTDERVVCILTGHSLKDPDATVGYHTGIDTKAVQWPKPSTPAGSLANQPISVGDDLDEICRVIESTRSDPRN